VKRFAELYRALDETTRTSAKVAAMRSYFAACDPADGAWAVFFLSGRRLNRLLPAKVLRTCCRETAGIADWMFEECYGSVGDLAETMALLLPAGSAAAQATLAEWVEKRILPLTTLNDHGRRSALVSSWNELSTRERFVFNKLVTGAFRVGVSQGLVVRALAETAALDTSVIAHRLMGQWEPTPTFFRGLLAPAAGETDHSRPYPFCLAHPLPAGPEELGDVADWLMEWKWDGIRAQMIRRAGRSFIWSRGEEAIHDRFPELAAPAGQLPDGTVLDGEIVGWKDGVVLLFAALQRRIGRKNLGRKLLSEVPARFLAFDLLEWQGVDLRAEPLRRRRELLEQLFHNRAATDSLGLSPLVNATSWSACARIRAGSRDHRVEGLMLKRADSQYGGGRQTGLWWKWKVAPFTCDAVLIYAQKGHGRRADLYTDYTFGVWDQGVLVPFAKAYSGLTDAEIRAVDRFVRKNTVERFGPVRSVKPDLVFELAFESIQLSSRHKSGVAVRFPRMARWRQDKPPAEADSLDAIKALLRQAPPEQKGADSPDEARGMQVDQANEADDPQPFPENQPLQAAKGRPDRGSDPKRST
jgi:DNA ligase-1